MKRIILVSVLLAGSVAAVFAEWTKVVCAGGDGVFSRNRIEWEDDFADSSWENAAGGGIEGQLRLVKKDGLSFMFDFSGDFLRWEDAKGLGGTFLFGVGKDFMKAENNRLILSGVAGLNESSLTESNAFTSNGYDVDIDSELRGFIIGADLFFSRNLTENFGLFAQCTAGFGIGGIKQEYNFEKDDDDFSRSEHGLCTGFFVTPKIGVCWNF